MNGRHWLCAAICASGFPAAAAAEGVRPSAEAWAACAWREVPVTAQNWIDVRKGRKVTATPSNNPLATPEDVLELRLNTACPNLLPELLEKSIFSSARSRALENAKPTVQGKDNPNIKAFVCEYYMDGQLVFTVLSAKKSKTVDGVKPKCFRAQNDGSLTDA